MLFAPILENNRRITMSDNADESPVINLLPPMRKFENLITT